MITENKSQKRPPGKSKGSTCRDQKPNDRSLKRKNSRKNATKRENPHRQNPFGEKYPTTREPILRKKRKKRKLKTRFRGKCGRSPVPARESRTVGSGGPAQGW